MGLPEPITLKKNVFYVYKTGIPFFDAARLIGVAHLFFGTASAEVEDKGAYWEVSGVVTRRDEQQVLWVVEFINPTATERKLFEVKVKNDSKFPWKELLQYFEEKELGKRKGRKQELKAEYDAALQIGTRGVDPLAKYEVLAPRSTSETLKKCKTNFQEVAAATLGRAFAAKVDSRAKRQRDEMYILPIFRERFVLSGFLDYKRDFSHAGGGWIAAIWAALSILVDLTAKRLPVTDFAYTREVKGPNNQPIFSGSGYLGLERLCIYWWERVVQKGDQGSINLLRNLRSFLQSTSNKNIHEQMQMLARWIADFVANPNVEALVKIQQLKARILAASQSQNISGSSAVRQLLHRSELIKEVGNMLLENLPEVPWQVAESLARALAFREKGWMNQFTRLENAPNFSQFIRQVEHIISRGYYREQLEQGEGLGIREALAMAYNLADQLRRMAPALQDERTFRAWKAIFLLDVLSRARIKSVEATGEAQKTEEEQSGASQ
ncbi:hypothetical protein [Candidatus Caldatribacterium saccharofermentans]|uniref:hypothetical protein n=1 Tax=Candidatus Caldatribacterium saccharofermentans TaxID=1454753 RepID=UPI003CFC957F